MIFDYAVGNPPYQKEVDNAHKISIYHEYYINTENFADNYALISPARFLHNNGYTPKEWNTYMLNSPQVSIIDYYADSTQVFPTVSVMGGIVIVGYHKHAKHTPITTFTANKTINNILYKILPYITDNGSLKDIYYTQTKLFLDRVYKDYPRIHSLRNKTNINDKRMPSDAFIVFKDMLVDSVDKKHTYRILGRLDKQRTYKYLSDYYVDNADKYATPYNKYKVFIPEANGSPLISSHKQTIVIGKPVVGLPMDGCTMTFRTLGSFTDKQSADNLCKYLHTKFARFTIGIGKNTQHIKPEVFRFVPLVDFSNNDIIDWSLSIKNIDKQLYALFTLSTKEIEYIENSVKTMEYEKE